MVVFGWGGGTPKDQGPAIPLTCPNCKNDTMYRYAVGRKWFRLYFIPLIPYDTKHFLLCPICMSGKVLKGEEVRRAKAMVELTRLWSASQMTEDRYFAAITAYWSGDALPSPTPALQAGQPGSSSVIEATQVLKPPQVPSPPPAIPSLPPAVPSPPSAVPRPPWEEGSD